MTQSQGSQAGAVHSGAVSDAPAQALPAAVIEPRRNWSWAWLLPVLALGLAGVFIYQAWAERGPRIIVEFEQGVGIGPGDPVSFRGVRVGDVVAVELSKDLKRVAVTARLNPDARGLTATGSRFWIVRPEISAGRVSGLDTILGPRYLEGEPGDGPPTTRFLGLERPPGPAWAASSGSPLEIVLEASQRGSLSVDSPVLYRGMRVGSVREMVLSPDARAVEVSLAIDPAYRHLVRSNSKFWNAGGIGLDWGIMRGLSVKAGSLESLVSGGIAFATPTKPGEPVSPGFRFQLAGEPRQEWLDWSPSLPGSGGP